MSRGKKQNPLQTALPRQGNYLDVHNHFPNLYRLLGKVKLGYVDHRGEHFRLEWELPAEAYELLIEKYPDHAGQTGNWHKHMIDDYQNKRALDLEYSSSFSIEYNTLGYLENLASDEPIAAMSCDAVYAQGNKLLKEKFPSGIYPRNDWKAGTYPTEPTKETWAWRANAEDMLYLFENWDEAQKFVNIFANNKMTKSMVDRHKKIFDRIKKTTPAKYQKDVFMGYCKVREPQGMLMANDKTNHITDMWLLKQEATKYGKTSDFWKFVDEHLLASTVAKQEKYEKDQSLDKWL